MYCCSGAQERPIRRLRLRNADQIFNAQKPFRGLPPRTELCDLLVRQANRSQVGLQERRLRGVQVHQPAHINGAQRVGLATDRNVIGTGWCGLLRGAR